jgi:hypothetical protein
MLAIGRGRHCVTDLWHTFPLQAGRLGLIGCMSLAPPRGLEKLVVS